LIRLEASWRVESTMPPETLGSRATIALDDNPQAAFDQFSRRVIGLARVHLDVRLQDMVDPEDVVQSAYKSLFLRSGTDALAAEGWQGLWGLLTLITIRKCADRGAPNVPWAGCTSVCGSTSSSSKRKQPPRTGP
jgi:hypothetical protein